MANRGRLDVFLSKEELYEAFSSMKNGKSLDIHGFPCEFCKAIGDIVSRDLCCISNEAFFLGNLTTSLKQGVIKLIPGTDSPDTIGGLRLITFFSVSYKILAKALALYL